MVLIELTYKKSLDEVEKFLSAHRLFLDTYYAKGIFFLSGRKNPRDGGIILAKASKDQIKNIIKEDPFHRESIAKYTIIEFFPNIYAEKIAHFLNNHYSAWLYK